MNFDLFGGGGTAQEAFGDKVLAFVAEVGPAMREFQVADLRLRAAALGRHDLLTRDDRAWGPVVIEARRRGWIESTGRYLPVANDSAHGRPMVLWRWVA